MRYRSHRRGGNSAVITCPLSPAQSLSAPLNDLSSRYGDAALLPSQFCFNLHRASKNAETLRFAAKRGFICKVAQSGDRRTSLRSASPKARGLSSYGMKNIEAGGAQGKVIGKRYSNRHSAWV